MNEHIYTVYEITSQIKSILRNSLPQTITVTGELSNYKMHSSGHLYFSLKDSKSLLKAVMFNARKHGLSLKDGDRIVCSGYIGVYEPYGTYQLIADKIEKSGQGELYREFLRIKEKLNKEGLFNEDIKKPIPPYTLSIGIITSPTGAVINDIKNVLSRRAPYVKKYIYPASVQGENAHKSLIKGIEYFNSHIMPDVIIIGRGGGSMEDLWEFNNEELANAVHKSTIPVISAVGHETDFTICDFVSDKRAPTPSAAAEIAVRDREDIMADLKNMKASMERSLFDNLSEHKNKLHILKRNFYIASTSGLNEKKQYIDQLMNEMNNILDNQIAVKTKHLDKLNYALKLFKPSDRFKHMKDTIKNQHMRIERIIWQNVADKKSDIISLKTNLQHLSPLNILNKGYSIVYNDKNDIIKNYDNTDAGDNISIRVSDGKIFASVNGKEKNDEHETGKKDL